MTRDRISGDELPSEGVAIGGDPDCEHPTYQRVGSDGGSNIYFNCTECSKVVLKYSAVEDRGGVKPGNGSDSGEYSPGRSSNSRHDPLVKGLSFDAENRNGHSQRQNGAAETAGFIERFRSRIRELLGNNEDNKR